MVILISLITIWPYRVTWNILAIAMVYVDDILVYSSDERSHKQHLRQVFQRLVDYGLTLHGEKCTIGVQEVSYLGHTFTKHGMIPDSNKVKAIQN